MDATDLDAIEKARAGEALAALMGTPGQVVFRVRERSAVIKYLGQTWVDLRAGGFQVGDVFVVAVAFRVGRYVSNEYAIFWDYCRPGDRAKLEAVSTQDYLSFSFFGDSCRPERTLMARNTLKRFFADAVTRLQSVARWTPEEFDAAQREVRNREAPLWERLTEGEG